MATRYLATFLLQAMVLLAGVAAFLLLLNVIDGAPLAVALIVLVAWFLALQLELLPKLVEWWVLRWAARHAPTPSIFFVDVEAVPALSRERRDEHEENPSLW